MEPISACEFASKFNSKIKIKRFLWNDCKANLPGSMNFSIYFFKDLLNNAKRVSI